MNRSLQATYPSGQDLADHGDSLRAAARRIGTAIKLEIDAWMAARRYTVASAHPALSRRAQRLARMF